MRALLHSLLPRLVAPVMSEEGRDKRRVWRYDRVMGWVEVCRKCKAVHCGCRGLWL